MNQLQNTYAPTESSPPGPPSLEGVDVREFMALCARIAVASQESEDKPADWKTTGRKAHAFSPAENRVFAVMKELVQILFDECRLVKGKDYSIEEDAIGNLYVTYYGKNTERTIMVGSHGDSVDNGGQFDGAGGVVAGYQALKMCVKNGQKPECNVTLFVARAEESSPVTGKGMFGSGVAAGKFVGKAPELNAMQHLVRGIPLSEHFGSERWEKILALAENPWIKMIEGRQYLCLPGHKPMELVFVETHIEQGTILHEQGKKVGIVDTIGGSTRWKIKESIAKTQQPENERRYYQFTITITGEENHTGGTRMNPGPKKTEGSPWHRKDALVAASDLFALLQKNEIWDSIHVVSTATGGTPNFTTIPGSQTITLACEAGKANTVRPVLESLLGQCGKECDIAYKIGESQATPQAFLDKDLVAGVMAIPRQVETIARNIANQCTDCISGPFRSTVTTLLLNATDGLDMHIDGRDIYKMEKAKEATITHIEKAVRDLLQSAGITQQGLTRLSKAPAKSMDQALMTLAEEIATRLGIEVMRIPSFAGHDIHGFQLGLLLFMAQVLGWSHRPDEDLTEENARYGLALYMAVVHQLLFTEDQASTTTSAA